MRIVLRLLLVLVVGALAAHPAHALNHLMQIEQVIGGVKGDVTAQAIQLRMRASFQNLTTGARLRAWDATGSNPIIVVDMANDVANGGAGVRVLLTTPDFHNYLSGPLTPDFTITNPIPASYLAAGSLTFEADAGTIYWRLSWGGSNYTGTGAVSPTNDAQLDGTFNPPFPNPLPHMTTQAVITTLSATAGGTSNLANYTTTAGAAVLTNNANVSRTVTPLPGCSVYPGIDLFTTPGGGTSYQDFSGMPIPGGFFDPGSDPFGGTVVFGGQPLAPASPLGPTDTVVQRKTSAVLPNPGDQTTIPIEIVALSLVSSNPITVTYNGGQNPQQWQVGVCLSSAAPQPQGSMTIRASGCGCPEGGTFTSTLPVIPKLTFVRISDLAVRVLDCGALPLPCTIQFQTLNGHWLPADPGFNLVNAPAGLSVDHDCDALTPPKTNLPPTTNFFAGLRADHCGVGLCGDPVVFRKRLTQEQAALAAHGVLPAQPCLQDRDRDGFCDDADNCPNQFNPLQEDRDDDGIGDACDNCVPIYNPCQEDANFNGVGDACEVADVGDLPVTGGVLLGAPAPNPVSGALSYSVTLPRAAHVRVAVYDVGGQVVRTLIEGTLPAGQHPFTWDARGESGARVASGIYYLRLAAGGARQSRKFMLVR